MPIPDNRGRKQKAHPRTKVVPVSEENKAKVAYYINAYLFSRESSDFFQFVKLPKVRSK